MAVQVEMAVDLENEVLRDVALIQGVLETTRREVGVPSHSDLESSDQGVKVDQDL